MAGGAAESGRTVTSKVTAILMAFSRGGTHSLTELAGMTGLPISTTHRLANELVARRLLERSDEGGYRIGLPLRMLGSTRTAGPSPAQVWERASEVMVDLATATRTGVRAGMLDGDVVLETHAEPGRRPAPATTGRPPHATALGHALLAFSPAAVVDRILAGVPLADELRRTLGATRLTHVALLRRQDVLTVAMPVFGAGGVLLAGLELGVPAGYDGLDSARAALAVATGSLSRMLATAAGEPDDHAVAYHS